MARTLDTLHIWTNLINRTNCDEGCIICNPYEYKTYKNPVMGRFLTRQNHLVSNRIRDGDFIIVGAAYHAAQKLRNRRGGRKND